MGRVGIYAGAGVALAVAVALAITRVGEKAGALSNWQALTLGIVQGLTELLPISSSAHLILVPWLGDWEYLKTHDEFNQTFDVALHLGTLVAVVVYFRSEIARLVMAWFRTLRKRRIDSDDERIAWFVAIATVPAAIVGGLGEEAIAENLGEPWQIAVLLALFAVVLWLADRTPARREMRDLGLGTAVAVGVAQSLALAPGVSRAGITISAARFLGLDRNAAARFSFLLLIPTVFGAVALKGVTDVVFGDLPPGSLGPFVVGTLAAAVSGLAAIWGLLGYVRRHDYSVFVVYRLLVAAAVLLVIGTGIRSADF
ncbi:MAG: undecaprenyl-diphosphatase UppP [Actinomycetota bacterium]|nr:undecaprenyl-diphosphatase UppP [Actinomycetota bacterium]